MTPWIKTLRAIVLASAVSVSLTIPATATETVDLEACVPALEAAETYSVTVEAAEQEWMRAFAAAQRIIDHPWSLEPDKQPHHKSIAKTMKEEAQAAYEQALHDAKVQLGTAMRVAYSGPTSDNPQVMGRILTKFLRDCRERLY